MITKINNSIQVLRWKDNITLKNIEQFRQMMEELTNSEDECLILNLRDNNYINSAGLGVIVDTVMDARKKGKELVIVEIKEAVKEIFAIVRFTAFMKIFQTEVEAVEYFMGNKDTND